MINLYEEIIGILEAHNKTIADIQYIICPKVYDFNSVYERMHYNDKLYSININNFMEIAKRTNYDNGYGGNEIPLSLKIVGKDWWLERDEYDGSEWFEYKTLPEKPEEELFIEKIKI